jgi:hypothetical protein
MLDMHPTLIPIPLSLPLPLMLLLSISFPGSGPFLLSFYYPIFARSKLLTLSIQIPISTPS